MRRIISAFLIVMLSHFCFCQTGFQESFVFDFNQNPILSYAVTSGDLDGDNDQDVIVAGEVSNLGGVNDQIAIIWFENLNGNGDFGFNRPIAILNDIPSEISIADLDGDGDMDVISPEAWYRNLDGQGNFETVNYIITPGYFGSVNTADFDGDGDLDILLSRSWLENSDGLGTMVLGENFFNLTSGLQSSFPGDLDNDGDIDIGLVTSVGDEIYWFENTDGLGDFGSAQFIGTNSFGNLTFIRLGDVDNDNDLDVVTASVFGGAIRLHRNMSNATSWQEQVILGTDIDDERGDYQSLELKDIDNDGDLDVSVSFDFVNYQWFENTDANGTYNARITPTTTSGPAINADIDGDNDLDVVAIDFCNNEIIWDSFPYVSQDEPDRKLIFSSIGFVNDLYFEDLNSDGVIDVIANNYLTCSSTNRSFLSLHENVNNFNSNVPVRRLLEFESEKQRVLLEDLDNDGDKDVIALDKVNDRIETYFNDGTGSFLYNNFVPVDYPTNSFSTEAFYLVDLDNDLFLDLLTLNFGSIVWYKNTNGVFGTPTTVTSGDYRTVAAYDFDGDDDNDVLFVRNFEIYLSENTDANGAFGPAQLIANFSTDDKLIVGTDIDADQDIDIVAFATDENRIMLLENQNGMGDFSSPIILVDNLLNGDTDLTSLFVERIDEDAQLDIVCSTVLNFAEIESVPNVYWLENQGSNQFSSIKQRISGLNSRHIDIADIDYDGDNDLVSWVNQGFLLARNLGYLGNTINGQIYFDFNQNGCASDDLAATNLIVSSQGSNDSFSSISQTDGQYEFEVNTGSFTTTLVGLPDYFIVTPSEYITDFVDSGNTETLDFCLTTATVANDLIVVAYPISDDPRPGFNTSYQLVYRNLGTTPQTGTVSFEYDDSKLTFVVASETVSAQTSNTVSFDFTNLNPFETRTINLGFSVFAPPTTNIGDVLESTTSITPSAGDITLEDNSFELDQIVVGSYDPNDISCLEGEQIFIDDSTNYLHYLIRFQNTGTASAINVRVENRLDEKLDWNTFQLESMSHNGRVEIVDGNHFSFIFDNINLPDSTSDEANSNGFIAYRIKPNTGASVGDVFSNTASIFFDFNPPIITNTALTEIVDTLSDTEQKENQLLVFPNPTNELLTIRGTLQLKSIIIVDLNGRLIKNYTDLNTEHFTCDVSDLTTGIYFMRVLKDKGYKTIKFIKN